MASGSTRSGVVTAPPVGPDDPLVRTLRRHERERFLASLFAPADRRAGLWALLAFNFEIARVRETVSQPLLGQIRLQWWRDVLDEAYGGRPVRRHAVATPLAETIRRWPVRRDRLDALIDGRERDLDPSPPATLAELDAYAEATSSRLHEAMLDVLGVTEPAAIEAARAIGAGWALTGLVRAIPFHAASGRNWLPQELDAEADPRAAVRRIVALARSRLATARARQGSVPRAALPALLPGRLVDRHLARIAAAGFDPAAPALAMPDPWTALRLWWAATLGRF